MSLASRLKWLIVGRNKLRKSGVWSHWQSYVCPHSKVEGGNKFGKGTYIVSSTIGRLTYVVSAKVVRARIGAFCSIGQNVTIGGMGAHPTHWVSTHPAFYSIKMQATKTFATSQFFEEEGEVVIGNDVWVGASTLILDGVKIADGAVIAAGSVVTKDVPPYAVVGGIPAKLIRTRFDQPVIDSLTKWQWWNLPDRVIEELAPRFRDASNCTEEGIDQLRQLSVLLASRQIENLP